MTTYRINTPTIVNEIIDGETIIINLDTGTYYSFDNISTVIWQLIGQHIPAEQLAQALSQRFTGDFAEIERATTQFIDKLLHEILIVPADGAAQSVTTLPTDGVQKPPFQPPTLHVYTDMQDLLLLDPIHQVDELGWPNALPQDAEQE